MDVRPEDRELEQPAGAPDSGVGPVRLVRRDRPEHRHAQVEREHDENDARWRRPTGLCGDSPQALSSARTPRAARAAIARHAIGMKRSGTRVESRPGTARQSVSYPGRFPPRASRQGTSAASPRTTASPRSAPHGGEPDDREERRQPAEEDELLDARPDSARDEVRELGRVPLDLRERATRADRACDRPSLDDEVPPRRRPPRPRPLSTTSHAGASPMRSRAPAGSRRARGGAGRRAEGRPGRPPRARSADARGRGASPEGGTRRARADVRSTAPRGTA